MTEMTMNPKAIGKRLLELRGTDLSQDDVAKAVGLTRAAISMYEKGKRIPGDQTKIALAHYYGTTVGEIFYDEPRSDIVGARRA